MSSLTWAWEKRSTSTTVLGNGHGRQDRQTLPELGLPHRTRRPCLALEPSLGIALSGLTSLQGMVDKTAHLEVGILKVNKDSVT